jgi:hypothetical protein
MRYRIQIEGLMGHTLIVVTEIDSYGGRSTATTKMYTIEGEQASHGGLVEVLGELQRMIGESTP